MNQHATHPLETQLAQLRRDRQPPRDLWPEIRPRLKPRSGKKRVLSVWAPLVAAAAMAVWWRPDVTRRPTMTSSLQTSPIQSEAWFAAEASYADRIQALSNLLAQTHDRFDPEINALVSEQLLSVEYALWDARLALAVDPTDPVLQTLHEQAVQQKLALFEHVVYVLPRSA